MEYCQMDVANAMTEIDDFDLNALPNEKPLRAQLHENLSNTVLDLSAATKILCLHIGTFESLFCVLVSIVATTAYYVFGTLRNPIGSFGANISWTVVSLAVVSPMIMQIRQVFTRREQALSDIAEARVLVVNIFLANAIWDWGDNGRAKLPAGHTQKTKEILLQVIDDACGLLLQPTTTRGRHRFTSRGRAFARRFVKETQERRTRITTCVQRLHQQIEVMKSAGLPANEASRINDYHFLLQARLEKLGNVKFYRSPQATRSFIRLFILILPMFYGPYYVYLLGSKHGHYLNFGFCLALSILTSGTMIGLFHVELTMEDPFVGNGLDEVRVSETFEQLRTVLDQCDRQAQQQSHQ